MPPAGGTARVPVGSEALSGSQNLSPGVLKRVRHSEDGVSNDSANLYILFSKRDIFNT